MGVFSTCCNGLRTLSRAAAKSAAARLRDVGLGATHPRWADRAAICERCPLRAIVAGRTYCGQPLLNRLERDPAVDGCGCPTHAKARDPAEHCPIDARHKPAARIGQACTCKWCAPAH